MKAMPAGEITTGTATTGSRGTRLLGAAALGGAALLLLLGLVWSPEDSDMGDLVRIMYVHVPAAWMAYLAFGVTALGSIMVLWKRSVWWDLLAGASAEIGAVYLALALITGSIWGRPTWGTYWQWGDVRIVTTLVLLLMFVGYNALRRAGGDERSRVTRCAVVGLLAALNIPIVRFSVTWWADRTLHQDQTVALDPQLDDLQLFALIFGTAVFTVIYAWMLLHRFRIAWLERELETTGLAHALEERRAEGRSNLDRAIGVRP